MERLCLELLALSILLACCFGASPESVNGDLVIKKVENTIDLTTHLPKISSSIILENEGKAGVRSFLFAVDPTLSDTLSYIGAVVRMSLLHMSCLLHFS